MLQFGKKRINTRYTRVCKPKQASRYQVKIFVHVGEYKIVSCQISALIKEGLPLHYRSIFVISKRKTVALK